MQVLFNPKEACAVYMYYPAYYNSRVALYDSRKEGGSQKRRTGTDWCRRPVRTVTLVSRFFSRVAGSYIEGFQLDYY